MHRTVTWLVLCAAWRRSSGETFFAMEEGQTIAIDIAHAAAGLREALPMLHKGEKAMLWLPSAAGATEALAYEVELVDVVARPASAETTKPARDAGRGG